MTGISTPLVAVSWQPTDLEVTAARRVIAFLEDRCVLYAPDSLEVPEHCVHSVLEIRRFLSDELGKHDSGSGFAGSLRVMRAACRKFLDRVGTDGREVTLYANHHGHWASWTFYSADSCEVDQSSWVIPIMIPERNRSPFSGEVDLVIGGRRNRDRDGQESACRTSSRLADNRAIMQESQIQRSCLASPSRGIAESDQAL